MISASHGVYLRNAHGQDVLLRPEGITWRPIGGSIDLHFFAGPTQPEVTRSYQKAAVGFPAMQKYSALGYHQGRWGYANWSELQAVVDGFDRFEIPLEYIWWANALLRQMLLRSLTSHLKERHRHLLPLS